ncbi:MAG TPA: glycerophosphodiester phosphodiesterase [Gemmatimonadaceae bacterium]
MTTDHSAPMRIAHRGMPRRAPENTIPSFALALASGAQGIELDVHATHDDVIVVHHDEDLADGRSIRRTTLADLRPNPPSAHDLPTLAEVLIEVDGKAELFVEIKGAGIEQLVARLLEGYSGAAAIHSFDHAMIGRLAASGCQRRLGLLVETTVSDVAALLRLRGARDLWPRHSIVTERMVRESRDIGARVIPWTVNDAADARRLASLGVDGICTDDVEALADALREA